MTRLETLMLRKGTIALLRTKEDDDHAVCILDKPRAQRRWLILAFDPAWNRTLRTLTRKPRIKDNSRPLTCKERGAGLRTHLLWRVVRPIGLDEIPQYLAWTKTPAFDRILKGETLT
jgi:hypothetical protein